MFPYAMLATTTIFYSNDWPKRVLSKFRLRSSGDRDESTGKFIISKQSSHCIYEKNDDDDKLVDTRSATNKRIKKKTTFYHKFFTIFTILYLAEQSFLPYSHFITKVDNKKIWVFSVWNAKINMIFLLES